ncbi:MAG: hypothetical protein U9O87_08815 [Verrucomicrobiota bacterium]|nr:hypothetical protein [Verrucomicrobiota bacterium]
MPKKKTNNLSEVLKLHELQETEITRDETKILHNPNEKEKLEKLDAIIKEIESHIPESMLSRYRKLRNSGSLGVTKIKGTMCMGCYISIPQGDINRMKKGLIASICSHCGCYLNIEE